MPTFTSQREHARRVSRSYAAACEATARKAASLQPLDLIAGGGQTSFLEGQSRQQLSAARDQIKHFRGQSYTSIRPIAVRIAGQPFRLAKIVSSVRGKKNRSAQTSTYWRAGVEDFLSQRLGVRLKANEDIELVDQHDILDRLERPWADVPGVFGWHLKYATVASLKMTGTYCWWLPVTKGQRQIVYMPPNWVRPVATDKSLFDHFTVRLQGGGDEKPIPAKEIAYSFYPDPSNPIAGYGPFQASYESIIVSEFIRAAQKQSFQIGVNPPLIFRLSTGLQKDGKPVMRRLSQWQINQAKEAIMSRHRGMVNYGDPMFVDATIADWKEYSRKASEMDFGANSETVAADVQQAFGTSPYVTGAKGANRAESAEADAHFVNNVVNPDIQLLSQCLTVILLPKFDNSGQYVLFIEPCRTRDSQMEFQEWQLALQNGDITVNEFRTHVLRQPPVPWGDAVWSPKDGSLIPVAQLVGGYARPVGAGSMPTAITTDMGPGTNEPGAAGDVVDPDTEAEEVAEGEEPQDAQESGKATRVVF